MTIEFTDIITSEAELRTIIPPPGEMIIKKAIPVIDEHCKAFIARSPFLLISSSDANGNLDVSPKGDPAGFVQVLDEKTLAIPDRVGNGRADTIRNIIETQNVGLLFLLPGKGETLRVNGTAKIVRDGWLREQLAYKGKSPDVAIVVTVKEAFMHCAKCVYRSHLWDAESQPDLQGLASLAQILVDHSKFNIDVNEFQEEIDEEYRDNLY
ncbi:MAG: pyridoxamine 5'-phosphate oxidase family protein [Aggregatilineales bacterium]